MMAFGEAVRTLCEPYYSSKTNVRPPIDPEVYFKMLLVGFFENPGSERGIASRCADSLSIRKFLRYELTERLPDHSTLSVIRHRLPELVSASVFALVLTAMRREGLVRGSQLGFDRKRRTAPHSQHRNPRQPATTKLLAFSTGG